MPTARKKKELEVVINNAVSKITKHQALQLLEREVRVQEAIRKARLSYEICHDPNKFNDNEH